MKIELIAFYFGMSLLFLNGCTTYHSAVAKGNLEAIDRLLGEGDDVNAPNDMGISPLIHTVNLNQKECLLTLIKAGADINLGDNELDTPLHHAIQQGNVTFVRILLENGAKVNIPNKDGVTALKLLESSHNENMLRILKSYKKGKI